MTTSQTEAFHRLGIYTCSPHKPQGAPISAFTSVLDALWARPAAICGDGPAVPHIAARPRRSV